LALTHQTPQDSHAVFRLKGDLESQDDKQLAILELDALAGTGARAVTPSQAARELGLAKAPREWSGASLRLARVHRGRLDLLARRLAFWDAIYLPMAAATGLSHPARAVDAAATIAELTTLSRLLEATSRIGVGDALTAEAVNELIRPATIRKGDAVSPSARRKNDYLAHPLHKYKAKFFPRLARSLINITCPLARGVVLDPFSGSGTAPFEASIMGLSAVGFDIDPLSVFIGKLKCSLEEIDPLALADLADTFSVSGAGTPQLHLWDRGFREFKLPRFLVAGRATRLPPEAVNELEAEVGVLLGRIYESGNGVLRDCLLLVLSHALATKVSLRWMGTGDNRFALEIGHRSVSSIFKSHLKMMIAKVATYRALRVSGRLSAPGSCLFETHDAAKLPLPADSIDAVVTSPPYLPAASGRETYLRSRAVSLVALGLLDEDEILVRERQIVGSILCAPDADTPVPESVSSLAAWMAPQRARGPKANPTIAYFQMLSRCLAETCRVLRPGGTAAVVVSRKHSFYELTSRKVVREFDMAGAITELAVDPRFGARLKHIRTITIELPKMDFNARPGARGSYHEAILFLQKPA
jgi:tRNA G10  N-methylase Trm11